MDYSFNSDIARAYGVEEAVFIHNLYWWIAKNEANGRHYYDGKNWTYNSMEAFTKLFPFWSIKQVRRIIKKLSDNGVLFIGNYNKMWSDRTQWYALSEDIYNVYGSYQKGQKQVPEREVDKCPNGQMTSAQTGAPIPDSKPDSKHIELLQKLYEEYTTDAEVLQALQAYTEMRKSKKAALTENSAKLILQKLDRLCGDVDAKNKYRVECLNASTMNNWTGIFALKEFEDVIKLPDPVKVTPETDTMRRIITDETTVYDIYAD